MILIGWWDIGNLDVYSATTLHNDADHSGPYICVENDFTLDDASDNPPGVGECVDLKEEISGIKKMLDALWEFLMGIFS